MDVSNVGGINSTVGQYLIPGAPESSAVESSEGRRRIPITLAACQRDSRMDFIEETIKAAAEYIEMRELFINVKLVKDPITKEQCLEIRSMWYPYTPIKELIVLTQNALTKLNNTVNSVDRRYGLFWMQVNYDTETVRVRFNATDDTGTIAEHPDTPGLIAALSP